MGSMFYTFLLNNLDFYNYFGWDQGEYKALMEVFSKDEFEYKAFALNSKRCVIQIK